MKHLFSLVLTVLFCVSTAFAADEKKPTKETVIFNVEIHCDGCADKIMKNIAFEKGVRDLRIDKEKQQVTVVYNPQKTNEKNLRLAFAKIGKPVHDEPLTAQENAHHEHH